MKSDLLRGFLYPFCSGMCPFGFDDRLFTCIFMMNITVWVALLFFELSFADSGLFLFCGRRCDRIKGLLWEGDGFLMLYKRLDNGRFQWPRNELEARKLTPQQTRWLLEGLSIEQSKAIQKGTRGVLY